MIKITQIKSKIGRLPKHKATILGLGLRRINDTVIIQDNLSTRGMIKKVSYMLKIEEL